MTESIQGTILYGMMGSGKSTLGFGLAEHLGQTFVDTDSLIEDRFGLSCSEIVLDPDRDFGEHQSLAVRAYLPISPEVVATGGSLATYPELVKHLSSFGVGIFIDVDPDVLEARLPAHRIAALNNPKNLSFGELCEARAKSYRNAADLVLKVAIGETPQASLESIIELRESFIPK
jgi:shikimate kinase